MNEFDLKAAEWDKSRMRQERAAAVAAAMIKELPLNHEMSAMEFGAGTGLLSFILMKHLGSITLIDNSEGMLTVLREKVGQAAGNNLKVMRADLEKEEAPDLQFDLIYTLMALHHLGDVEIVLSRLGEMLKPGGYLALSDLYSEDGSFHGRGFTGHHGFNTGTLADTLKAIGFREIKESRIYTIEKFTKEKVRKQFDLFLMTAVRP